MQFSIRAVLALTLLASGICGLMFGVPDEYLMYALSAPWCVLPGALISALVYGRGYVRAFAIGAMPVAFPALFWALVASASAGAVDVDDASTMRYVFAGGVAAVVLAGGTGAGALGADAAALGASPKCRRRKCFGHDPGRTFRHHRARPAARTGRHKSDRRARAGRWAGGNSRGRSLRAVLYTFRAISILAGRSCGKALSVTTQSSSGSAALSSARGWPARFCSSGRRASANGPSRCGWPSRCYVRRVRRRPSIRAAPATAACNCWPACIRICWWSRSRPTRASFRWPPSSATSSAACARGCVTTSPCGRSWADGRSP